MAARRGGGGDDFSLTPQEREEDIEELLRLLSQEERVKTDYYIKDATPEQRKVLQAARIAMTREMAAKTSHWAVLGKTAGEENERLRKENKKLKENEQRLKNEMAAVKRELEETKDNLDDAYQHRFDLENELKDKNEEITDLRNEKADLERKLKNLQLDLASSREENKRLSDKYKTLLREYDGVSKRLEESEKENKKLRGDIVKVTQERDSLYNRVQYLSERNATLEEENSRLKKLVEDLQKQLQTSLSQIEIQKQEINRKNEENAKLFSANAISKMTIATLQVDKTKLEENIKALEGQLSQALVGTRSFKDLQATNVELLARLRSIEKDESILKGHIVERDKKIESQAQEIAILNAKITASEAATLEAIRQKDKAVSALSVANVEIQSLRGQLESEQRKNVQLKDQIGKLESEIAELRQAQTKAIKDKTQLERDIDQLKRDYAAEVGQLNLKTATGQAEKEKIHERYDSALRELNKLLNAQKENIAKLTQDLSIKADEYDTAQLAITDLKTNIGNLTTQLKQKDEKINRLETELISLTAKNEEYKEKFEQQALELQRQGVQITGMENEKLALVASLTAAKSEQAKLIEQQKRLASDLKAKEDQVNEFKKAAETAEKNLKNAKGDTKELKENADRALASFHQAEQEKADISKQHLQAVREAETQKARANMLQAQVNELEQKVTQFQSRIARLEEELDHKNKVILRQDTEIGNLKQQNIDLIEQNKQAVSIRDEALRERDQKHQEIESLKANIQRREKAFENQLKAAEEKIRNEFVGNKQDLKATIDEHIAKMQKRHADEMAKITQRLEETDKQLMLKDSQLARAETQVSELGKQLARSQEEVRKLEFDLKQVSFERDQALSRVKELSLEVQSLRAKYEEEKAKRIKTEALLDEAHTRIQIQNNAITRLEDKIHNIDDQLSNLEKKGIKDEKQIIELQNEQQTLKRERDRIYEERNRLESELAKTQEKLKQSESEVEFWQRLNASDAELMKYLEKSNELAQKEELHRRELSAVRLERKKIKDLKTSEDLKVKGERSVETVRTGISTSKQPLSSVDSKSVGSKEEIKRQKEKIGINASTSSTAHASKMALQRERRELLFDFERTKEITTDLDLSKEKLLEQASQDYIDGLSALQGMDEEVQEQLLEALQSAYNDAVSSIERGLDKSKLEKIEHVGIKKSIQSQTYRR